MSDIAALVADNLDIWTSAIEHKSSSGRGSSKKISLYGIERLRALILDLALRGQLVPQDADDEPASKLLDRISETRKVFDPKFKVPNLPETEVDEAKVPTNWERVCLAELAKPQAGFAFKSKFFNETGEGLALIRIRDVGQPFTGTYYSGEYRPEFEVEFGDYLISMDGEFRVATWEGDKALLNQRVTRLQFFETDLERSFVAIALQQELTKLQGVKAYTTVDHLSGKQIAASQIPVPPLAEQKRIVAKVDELMALCDALERESEDALAAHQTLVETLLATLVNGTDPSDLAKNWARLETHFDTLFTTEASVDALKQTILDLAVRGKLVEQDKDAGPASTHLALDSSKNDRSPEGYPNLPNGWACCPLGQIIGGMDSGWSPACHPFPAQSEDKWGVLKTTAVQELEYRQEENKELPEKFEPRESAEARAGDILITRAGPTNRVGICCFVPETRPKLMISDKIIRFRPSSKQMSGQFLALALSAGPAAQHLEGAKSGMASSQVNISQTKLKNTWLMLPPPAEQRRIIAKVDELVAICDALKSRLSDAAETQRHLADAIVERAAA